MKQWPLVHCLAASDIVGVSTEVFEMALVKSSCFGQNLYPLLFTSLHNFMASACCRFLRWW